jgi:hypothetical protein
MSTSQGKRSENAHHLPATDERAKRDEHETPIGVVSGIAPTEGTFLERLRKDDKGPDFGVDDDHVSPRGLRYKHGTTRPWATGLGQISGSALTIAGISLIWYRDAAAKPRATYV